MKKIATLASVALFTFGVAGAAFAQTPTAPTAPVAPTTTPTKPMKMTAAEKAALSKKCSADADAQKLHGDARKKFREDCKKKGAM